MNETYALSGNIVDEVGGRIARLTPDGGRYHSSRPAKALGEPLSVPFMTLSFMALLVIPPLKMSDLDLGDGDRFRLTGLFS